MAKNAITDLSTNAALNTDIGGVDAQGTAPASNMNDLVQELGEMLADTNAGTAPWADTMTIGDAADLTKELRFELSGFTTGTTRVLTPPNYDGTIATLAGTETFTNKTLSSPTFTGVALLTNTEDSATGKPDFTLYRDSATPAVSDVMGRILFDGEDSAGNQGTYALIQAVISDATSTAEDGILEFATVVAGTVAGRVSIGGGLYTNGVTGGDKGAGTINASDVYNDNVALTCMALADEFRTSKEVKVEKWDDMVPNIDGCVRKHPTAQAFKELIDTGFDPRDPDQYFQKMEADQALPGMPNQSDWKHNSLGMGEMMSRLWLAMEMQALVIKALADKIKLESGT